MSTPPLEEVKGERDVEKQEEEPEHEGFSSIDENTPLLASNSSSAGETAPEDSGMLTSFTQLFHRRPPNAEVASSQPLPITPKPPGSSSDSEVIVEAHVTEDCKEDVLFAEPLTHAVPFHNPFNADRLNFQHSESAIISHIVICSCGMLLLLLIFVLYWQLSGNSGGTVIIQRDH